MIYMNRSIKSGYINQKKKAKPKTFYHSFQGFHVVGFSKYRALKFDETDDFIVDGYLQAWVTKNSGNIGASWATNKHNNSFARNRHMQIVFP